MPCKLFLFHGQTKDWVKQTQDTLVVRFLCHDPDNLITERFVRCEPDNEERLIPCEAIPNDMLCSETVFPELVALNESVTLYQASIPISEQLENTYYTIKCLSTKKQFWLSAMGLSNRIPGRESHFKFNTINHPPAWVQSQVFYQIFPDRFNQGEPDIAVKTGEYLYQGGQHAIIAKKWGEPVAQQGHDSTGASEFYGGDLKGIHNKLDYLQTLGVSALYLNPIFTSPSNHKYDTTDYLNVDSHLGSNQSFAELTASLHTRGMKIILDAVFNHTSCEHPWFGRYQPSAKGAFNQPTSPYRDHYIFTDDSNKSADDHYISWKAIETLPKLNFVNEEVQNYLYKSDACVLKHWLKAPYNIDGWRFDVIHMLGEGTAAVNNAHYVKAFRESAKSVNKEAYIVGEHFFEATQWLQGEQEDGAMNYYGFAHPVRAFFAGLDIAYHPIEIDAQEFDYWLAESRAKIPWLNQLAQLNQLDSHDTKRFINQLKGNKQKLKAASMMLFSYPGVPCLYYGTEVMLAGESDPDNRRCFPWQTLDTNSATFIFYQRLIALRKQRLELQQGDYHTLHAENRCFAFARYYKGDTTIYALNLDDSPQPFTFNQLDLMSSAVQFSGFDTANQNWHVNTRKQDVTIILGAGCALLLSSAK